MGDAPLFAQISSEFLRSPDFSPNAKALYGILLTYLGTKDFAYPSQAKLCSHLGISKNSLRKAIEELKGAGLIEVKRGGNGKNSQYTPVKHIEAHAIVTG